MNGMSGYIFAMHKVGSFVFSTILSLSFSPLILLVLKSPPQRNEMLKYNDKKVKGLM